MNPKQPQSQNAQGRLNVLLTVDRPREDEHWTRQISVFLQPMGVNAIIADTGQEAIEIAKNTQIHAALIDLETPTGTTAQSSAGGFWLMELLNRLEYQPPVIVVRSPTFDRQELDRLLIESMRLGAFSVLDKPLNMEDVLANFKRLLDKQYRGNWPQS